MKRNNVEILAETPTIADVYRKHGHKVTVLPSRETIPQRKIKAKILEEAGVPASVIQHLRTFALMPCLSDTIPNHTLRREIQNELGTDHPALKNDALRVANIFAAGLMLETLLNYDQLDENIKSKIRKIISFTQRWLNQENGYYKLSKRSKISKVRALQKQIGQIYILLTE